MAEIVLFHSAQGLRRGVGVAAEILRGAGHSVRTPDYYDGEVFDDVDGGLRKRDSLGLAEIDRRVRRAVADVGGPVVFAGFSLGAYAAQRLAAWHPKAVGAVLLHGGGLGEEPAAGWPGGVPVQVHYTERDPWVDPREVDVLERAVTGAGARFERHVYPGDAHLFADPDLPDHRPEEAGAMWDRVLTFLREL
ncbi:dienelactone hydrolase family protein [Bailinhaonella thermotolerans]|nr:dienelactone hydrolase family protein [Bailinhaonella thermotolerans]